ncbi:amino acid/amide ABC transporter ATP-binding protein 1, HAAT family [Micromonospora pallida]|uniref:Amino acid/amide ABC transporter ATP-binding protein 1, HAAT family n=1 Tax=Micromonospora pallida TaxID=145854 RepID=A0A1C6RSN9_9ACTN|nr:ABC transporter ATP-binding protein [Micromonospora pallida]SCL20062.1 amino acid/amide ABC transporter ATP-binding protein 1, HAAT family [Micromonospora pallida]
MSHLEVVDIRKRFGGLEVLHGVSMRAEMGRVTALIGPNGAGKSTLANIISGYVRADSGRVVFAGHDLTRKRVHQRAALGLGRTFQNLELFHGMSVAENVTLGRYRSARLRWFTGPGRHDAPAVTEALRTLTLADQRDQDVGSLSFGRAKMVEPARVVVAEPSMIVMDEPAAGLTSARKAAFGHWIRGLLSPTTGVVLIEHDMQLIMSVSDYIYVLDHGVLIADGTPDEVRRNDKVREAYLGTGEEA